LGGGMCNHSSDPTVENCTFSGNEAGYYGGGMYNQDSDPTVENCAFSGNDAESGGGMWNFNSSLTVTNCTFSGNRAEVRGGGMWNVNSSPMVTNCTFSGNRAEVYGGGMYNEGGDPTVTNCTFSGNRAEVYGGGMYNYDGSPTVSNTIVAGNTPDDCAHRGTRALNSGGYNLESGTSCGCTHPTDLQNTDPLLGPLADNGGATLTHALLPGSPAIDAIPAPYNGAPSTDQRGLPRPYPVSGLADIGAVEMELPFGKGDVNSDGVIDLLDVVLCQQIASGLVHGTAAQRAAADVDDDGDVDADDVMILSEVVLGIRAALP